MQNTAQSTSGVDVGAPPPPQKPSLTQRLYTAIKQGRLLGAVKRRLKPMFIRVGQAAMKQPLLKRMALGGLNYTPGLKVRLHRILWSELDLSPRGLHIYTELKTAIEAQALAKTQQKPQAESRA